MAYSQLRNQHTIIPGWVNELGILWEWQEYLLQVIGAKLWNRTIYVLICIINLGTNLYKHTKYTVRFWSKFQFLLINKTIETLLLMYFVEQFLFWSTLVYYSRFYWWNMVHISSHNISTGIGHLFWVEPLCISICTKFLIFASSNVQSIL